ncbi:Alpha N-terminal protein methyltransferase 1B [Paramecium bursaria]
MNILNLSNVSFEKQLIKISIFYILYQFIYFIVLLMKFNINRYKITSNKTLLNDWYKQSEIYWKQQDPNYNGMMGGYDSINKIDIQQSIIFFDRCQIKFKIEKERALDLGCGIGRITDQFLSKHFKEIHLVDRNQDYLNKAQESLKMRSNDFKILTQFNPEFQYDCIWIQWVSIYLQDDDFINLLKRLQMKNRGLIFLKENVLFDDIQTKQIDLQDFQITRSRQHYRELIKQSGLRIIGEMEQVGIPQEIYPIRMFCMLNIINNVL